MLHTMPRVLGLDASLDFYTTLIDIKLLRKPESPDYTYTLAIAGYGEDARTVNHTVIESLINTFNRLIHKDIAPSC